MIKVKLTFLVLVIGLFCFTQNTLAAGLVPCGDTANDPCTLCHLIIGFKGLVDYGLGILVIAAITGITIGGVLYTISAGNDKNMGNAKAILGASIKGFAIALGAWLIINIIMWLLAAKPDLGISVQNWYTFSCSTLSNVGTGGGAREGGGVTPTGESACCIKQPNEREAGYGTGENCKAVNDDGTCPEGFTTKSNGSCSSMTACGAQSGRCTPTNNGCGGLRVQGGGCEYTSANLASKLSCIKGKVPDAIVTSVTLNAHSDWCEKCVYSYSESYCSHGQYSCHFGGRNCKGNSVAVDFGKSNGDAVLQAAKECGFDTIIWRHTAHYRSGNGYATKGGVGDHDPSEPNGHVHASVDNSSCGCDYLRGR